MNNFLLYHSLFCTCICVRRPVLAPLSCSEIDPNCLSCQNLPHSPLVRSLDDRQPSLVCRSASDVCDRRRNTEGDTSVTAAVTIADGGSSHSPPRTWYVFPHAPPRRSASTALASRHLLHSALLTFLLIILISTTTEIRSLFSLHSVLTLALTRGSSSVALGSHTRNLGGRKQSS